MDLWEVWLITSFLVVNVPGPWLTCNGWGKLLVYTFRKSLPARNGAADLNPSASLLACVWLRCRWLIGSWANFEWLNSLPFFNKSVFFCCFTYLTGFCSDFSLLGGFYCRAVAISLMSLFVASGLKCCLFRTSRLCNSSGVSWSSERSPTGRSLPSLLNVPYSELCKAATA